MAHQDPRDLADGTQGRGYAQRVSPAFPAWLRKPSPRVVDVALTVLVGLPVVAGSVVSGIDEDRIVWGVVIGLAATAPLLVRRRWPFAVLAITVAIAALSPVDVLFGLPLLISLYTIGANRSWQATVVAVASVVATAIVYVLAGGANTDVGEVIGIALLCVLGAGAGLYVGGKRSSITTLEQQTERLNRERRLLAERAVAEERVRIAQELHDVVAHNVSLIVVQAQALGATAGDGHVKEATDGIADLGAPDDGRDAPHAAPVARTR